MLFGLADGDGHELSAAKGSNEDTGDGLSTPQSSQTAQGISDYSRALVVQQEVEEGHFICTAKFELPLDAPKLLMLGIAEGVAAVATTRENAGMLPVLLFAALNLGDCTGLLHPRETV